ncbi:MAG: histidine phosphatase family protein [Alphaproteobacteria bacterium]|nr:histidine phosphatase family protein [Alphaproteobacteria bacterium]
MKQLYLLRHAHAEPHGLGWSDFDRPLDERGHAEGKAIAAYLRKKKISFDFVMCSAALRAQETLEPLRPIIEPSAIEISKSFYDISEDKILEHLTLVSEEKDKVLYIGHNPGVAFSILKFAKVMPHFLTDGVTPGTLTGLQFPFDKWMDLEWGRAEIIDLFQPYLAGTEVLGLQEP